MSEKIPRWGKVAYVSACALALAGIAGSASHALADEAQMKGAPKTESAANNSMAGKYAFNPKYRAGKTKAVPFGGGAKNWAKSSAGAKKCDLFNLKGTSAYKGKVGMLYRNIGQYQDHTLDLKVTLMDWNVSYKNITTTRGYASGKTKVPGGMYAGFRTNGLGVFDPGEGALKYRLSFLDDKTGKPVKMTGQWTFRDIDANQGVEFTKSVVDKQVENFYYSGNAHNSSKTWLDFDRSRKKLGNIYFSDAFKHHLKKAKSTGTVGTSDNRGALTLTYSNQDHLDFSWIYGNTSGKYVQQSQERTFGKPKDSAHPGSKAFFKLNTNYDANAQKNVIKSISRTVPRNEFDHAWLSLSAAAILPNRPDKPYKFVSDSDEGTNVPGRVAKFDGTVTHDTLKNRDEGYHYEIEETVPKTDKHFYYKNFSIHDHLDGVLNVKNIHVYNQDGQDVTNEFTSSMVAGSGTETPRAGSHNAGTDLKVTAQDHVLKRADFYDQTYVVTFDAAVKPGVSLKDHMDPVHKDQALVPNSASVTTNYGHKPGNKTKTNIPFTPAKTHKTVSYNGKGNTTTLNGIDFNKEYKYKVTTAVPDSVDLTSLALKDKIVPDVQKIKEVHVYDDDASGKDVTNQGHLTRNATTGEVTWTANKAKKGRSEATFLHISYSYS